MAAGISTPDNGKTWILKMRSNTKFTDGTPYDAAAVQFNFNRYMDPRTAFPMVNQVSDIDRLRVIDPLTLEITLKKAIGSWPIGLTDNAGLIGSPKALQENPTGFGTRPVGAGPMMLKEWVRDDHLDLVKNPDYFNAAHIYLDGIRYRAVPDGAARSQAMLIGQADVVYALIDTQLSITGNRGAYVWGGQSTGGYFNIPNNSRGPGRDKRIREAMQLAIDFSKVNKALYNGAWRSEKMDCPPFTKEMVECVPGLIPEPNIDRARQLVAQYKAEGNSVDLDYLIGVPTFQPQGEFFVQALQNIGLNPKVRTMAGSEWLVAINAGTWDSAIYARSAVPSPYPYINTFFEIGSREPAQAQPRRSRRRAQGGQRRQHPGGPDRGVEAVPAGHGRELRRVLARPVVRWVRPEGNRPAR